MIFRDREQAGQLLAKRLQEMSILQPAVVLGLPRGGVVPAYAIAKALKLPLDILCLRKIGAPGNPELAVGAISDSGVTFYNDRLIEYLNVSQHYLTKLACEEQKKAQIRLKFYRAHHPQVPLEGKTAILVDDGLATGATMHAAIKTVQAAGAEQVIVAIPVASLSSLQEIETEVDALVCLEPSENFRAVGQFYETFDQVEDEEVLALLKQSQF